MNKNNRFYKKLTALVATGLLTAAVSGTAFAADTVQLDLHDSVQMALENNRTIRQALTDVDTAKWTLSKARRTMGPTVLVQTASAVILWTRLITHMRLAWDRLMIILGRIRHRA